MYIHIILIYIYIYILYILFSYILYLYVYLFEVAWFPISPSSLPLCVRFPRRCGFGLGASRSSHRSNATFLDVYSVSPLARSHLKRFGLKIDRSLGCGAHVLSRPVFSSTGSTLGALDPKSLQYYNTFRVHVLETTIITYSKFELCTPIGNFELLAAVL